jgi:[acyl-carrier-protein] S-malonyltransferase
MGASALLFPGQGSQYVGMGKDLFDADRQSRELMELAESVLGVPIMRISFEGPDEELRQTKNTQPAIFIHSIAAFRAAALVPLCVAGHSLGEYSALVAAGALDFEDGLRLVRLRGELMQRAGDEQRGTMAAIVGMDAAKIEKVCNEASTAGVVQPANFNSPGQIVISGSVEGVRRAMELARAGGAKLVKELTVSGAFHSPLMESAREGLRTALDSTTIRDANVPVYANVTGEPVTESNKIRHLLYRQLTSPVRWEETIRNMIRDGAKEFTEVGPGKVLQGLVKRTEPTIDARGLESWSDVKRIRENKS